MKPNENYWIDINNFRDLQNAMIRWLNGNAGYNPWYYDEIVTSDITSDIKKLKEINNLGIVTTDSQSGNCDKNIKERGYLTGFIRKDLLSKISKLIDEDVLILVYKYDTKEYVKYESTKFLNNKKEYIDDDGYVILTTEEYPAGLLDNKEYNRIAKNIGNLNISLNELKDAPVKDDEKIKNYEDFQKILVDRNKEIVKEIEEINKKNGIPPVKEVFTTSTYKEKDFKQEAINNSLYNYKDEDVGLGNIGPKINKVILNETYFINLVNLDMCKKDLLDKVLKYLEK
tara:strand:+ start:85 stop:939 length:855 start_codon:yes stop_codon:yes gene_type:complete